MTLSHSDRAPMTPTWASDDGPVCLYLGDCIDVMRQMPENSVDSIVTDPPYGLEFMGKQWDRLDTRQPGDETYTTSSAGPYSRAKVRHASAASYGGTVGPAMQSWHYRWAVEALRVCKPGAIMLAFGGTRTWHRLACAIEDAGWEIRDTIMWVYGSGFPKSHDISKAIDKAAGAEREIVGRYQPPNGKEWNLRQAEADDDSHAPGAFTASGTRTLAMTAPATDLARTWNGWGTALKPAWEPIIVAMKPLDGTFAENAQKWGVAGLWIDGGRVEGVVPQTTQGASSRIYGGGVGLCPGGLQESNPHPRGRWPANLIHDGSDEVLAGFPQSVSSGGGGPKKRGIGSGNGIYGAYGPRDLPPNVGLGDSGSAARFFYVAKAGQNERWAFCKGCNIAFPMARAQDHQTHRGTWHADVVSHPTQKPLALMRYLVRLTRTPTGGVVLDPFAGGGTTVLAAIAEGRSAIAIELDAGYFDIMRARAQDAMLQVPLEMKA